MKKSLLQTILMGGVLLLVALASCKKEANKPGQLDSIKFKSASYTIAENDLSLNLRKELETVPAGVADTAKITWTISDETVAAMNGSFLEPKQSGDITVTASIQGKDASCDVQITKVAIQSVALEDFAVQINGTAKALLTTEPEGISYERFTWTVADNTIASIDKSGVVTGLKEGNTTVTATADDKSATCKLAVKKVVVKTVTVTPSSARMYEIGETLQLTATLDPADASFPTVTWKSSDPTWVKVDENGLVTVNKYNQNPVKITATADGVKGECMVTAYPQQSTSIVLNETSHTFNKIGDYFILYITKIEPAQRTLTDQFDWFAGSCISEAGSDPGVCIVEDDVCGLSRSSTHSVRVTCTGVGTDKVHCFDYWSHVDVYCTFTLPVKPVTSITLSKTSEEVSIVKGAFTIDSSVSPSDANEKLNLTISSYSGYGSGEATLSPSADGRSVTVTPKKAGYVAITASSKSTSAKCELYIVEDTGLVYDVKGVKYKTIKIGNQWWMAQNLICRFYDTESGLNGQYIGESAAVMSYPYFYYSPSGYDDWSIHDKERIGYAYNWAAAVGIKDEAVIAAQTGPFSGRRQGICPNGWHLPTGAEFNTLKNYIGGDWWLLASRSRWKVSGNPDKYGFCAMPVGIYNGGDVMSGVGEKCEFWTADASGAENAKSMYFNSYNNPISGNVIMDADIRSTNKKSTAYSVRCVRN